MRILILGGTTEASELSAMLADDGRFAPTLSLAGRTLAPRLPPVPHRVGGFGGADGLARWIVDHAIEAVIDATHPYAWRISTNAVRAVAETGTPLGSIVRPPWAERPGDRWLGVADPAAAAAALGETPRRVFLSLGRLELPAFAGAPQHRYLARTIDPVDAMAVAPSTTIVRSRGPFDLESEIRLLQDHAIEIVVSKNSGGAATYPKIEAARRLGLPVIMIARPDKPRGYALSDPRQAIDWLTGLYDALHAGHSAPRSPRGV